MQLSRLQDQHRLAAAAQIQSLAQELPYAMGAAEREKDKRRNKEKERERKGERERERERERGIKGQREGGRRKGNK